MKRKRTHKKPLTPARFIEWAVYAVVLAVIIFSVQACLQADLSSPPGTPILEDRDGAFLSEGESEYARLGFWDMPDPVPERIRACVLMIEDRRFESHMGVDLRSLGRALVHNLDSPSAQGASTIAMQVARLQHPAPRTLPAKLNEMAVAWWLLVRHGHENVLRQYLKLAPQGHQVYGFAYAARRFFRKPAADLSWAEAAVLAALPQSPTAMSVFNYWGFQRALGRARLILREVLGAGRMTNDAYREALEQLTAMNFQFRETRPENTYHFIFRCLEEARAGGRAGFSRSLRTTLDLDLQSRLQALAQSAVGAYRSLGAGNMAAIVADRKTGAVLAYVGSEDYYRDGEYAAGGINYARTPRSSGSAVKPFLYALGLDEGRFTPGSVLADLPFSIVGPSGEFSAGNFDETFLGPMLYRKALGNSRNTPTLRVLEGVGLERAYDMFRACNLGDGKKPASWYGYGLPIGGLYVTLEDLVAAYGILANDGLEFKLQWFVDGTSGSPAGPAAGPPSGPPPRRVFSAYAAREITLALSDPAARLPSFPRLTALEYDFPVAVKTGTSQGFRDAWAVACSRRYLIGVWIGHPKNAPMNHVSGSFIASLAHSIMTALHPEESRGVNSESFPLPPGSVAVRVCALSGEPVNGDCPETFTEYFKEGSEPHSLCRVHRRYRVDRTTGALTDERTPAGRIEERLFTVLPAEYAAWGVKQGFGKPPGEMTGREFESVVSVVHPKSGARFLLDPDLPPEFQTIALRAEVAPAVPEIVWYVDGKEFVRAPFPYETRWPLAPGIHTIQARFPKAFVASPLVTIKVGRY